MIFIRAVLCLLFSSMIVQASGMTDLLARGYVTIPEPQRVSLRVGNFELTQLWSYRLSSGVTANSATIRTLVECLHDRFRLNLNGTGTRLTIRFSVKRGSVEPGLSQDPDRASIADQAYRLVLSASGIEITANTETGSFYAVQSLLQLIKRKGGKLYLPEGEISDWPDLRLRTMYWDDAHHLEHVSDLKAAIRQASFYKLNGFALKLEGHFEFRSAPVIVEPQALSPAQLQELTDYGLSYHVQVIPYLDAPAHVAFILKHPEYSSLREFPDSNYELCATNPQTLKLLTGMYDDLLAANRGVRYFYLSTDEAYYIGMKNSPGCQEGERRSQLGSPGKVLAEFLQKAAGHLHKAGREVIFWGELPLKPADIASLPNFAINGETYGPKFDPLFRSRGIRQMIYGSTEGEEPLFPQYSLLPSSRRATPLHENSSRVADGIRSIALDPARKTSDLIGLTIAGWGDMGLHPETFWLGYTVITAAGWKPWTINADAASKAFYPLFYGPSIADMDKVYRLLTYQTQTWSDTWDRVPTTLRKGIWGDSNAIFEPRRPAHDQTLPLPPTPGDNLSYSEGWQKSNASRIDHAKEASGENDTLTFLLSQNLTLASFNRYNLEVLQSIALLCRQNLKLILGLESIDSDLRLASAAAGDNKPSDAIQFVDLALGTARQIRDFRNQCQQATTATWYKSWLPRVPRANGRVFLHQVDDVKDHLPDRTVDMSYLIYRDLHLPFDDWYRRTIDARNRYAQSHRQPLVQTTLNWSAHP